MTCPECQGDASKVLYLGLPMRLCLTEECHTVWGFWSYVPVMFPIVTSDGFEAGFAFTPYEGPYLAALWCWLMHEGHE